LERVFSPYQYFHVSKEHSLWKRSLKIPTHDWLRQAEQFVANSVGVFEMTIHEGVNNKKIEVLIKKNVR
jgi:hypothetical protein